MSVYILFFCFVFQIWVSYSCTRNSTDGRPTVTMERSVPSHQICVIYSSSFLRKKISHETASSVLYCFAICQLLKAGCAYKFRKSRHWLSTRSVFIDWPWMMTDFERIPSWRGKPAILTQGSFGIANPPPSLSMSSPHWCLRAGPHNLWYANQTPDRSFREKNSVHFSSIPSSSLVLKEKQTWAGFPLVLSFRFWNSRHS